MLAAIREVFSAGVELDREAAIRETARALGFQRAGPRIREELTAALRLAKRRGIIAGDACALMLACRDIHDYTRDELTAALLSAMGRGWEDRADAIRAATRSLGFRRTGAAIQRAFKSVINGAIRRGLLEYEGQFIRKLSNPAATSQQ